MDEKDPFIMSFFGLMFLVCGVVLLLIVFNDLVIKPVFPKLAEKIAYFPYSKKDNISIENTILFDYISLLVGTNLRTFTTGIFSTALGIMILYKYW